MIGLISSDVVKGLWLGWREIYAEGKKVLSNLKFQGSNEE
jgi:hypothetical protein